MGDKRIRRPERSLRDQRSGPEIHVRADDMVRAPAARRSKRAQCENPALGNPRVSTHADKRQTLEPHRTIRLAEQSEVMAEVAKPGGKGSAERSDSPAEAGERRSPDMDLQSACLAIASGANRVYGIGFGHRRHAHRHPYAEINAAVPPPTISTIDPFG